MPYAVLLYFDDDSGKPINEIWAKINSLGFSVNMDEAGIRPHITLAVYDQLTCQPCENRLAELASHTHRISLKMSYLGLFTEPEPVIFAAPIPTRELITFHQDVITALASDGNIPRDIHQPGVWIPHCTLAIGFEKNRLNELIDLSLTLKFPFNIGAVKIGVVEYQPLKDLFSYDLTAGEN